MPSWKKRFLRVKRGEKTTSDDPQKEESSIRLLDELSLPTDEYLAALKPGIRIQFYHYEEGSTDGFWMEGTIAQRVTKKDQAKRTNFATNWFNIENLKPLVYLGSASGTIPTRISINLSRHHCWQLVTGRTDTNILQFLSSNDEEEKIYHLDAADVALIKEPIVVEEDQHAAKEEIRDGAVALTRPQQGDSDQTNGMPILNQNFETSIPPPYQGLTQPLMVNRNTNPPQMGTSHQTIYPSLSDTSTVRATNVANPNSISTQPRGGYPAGMHSQTNHRKTVVPTSMTSIMSEVSNTSQNTKANLRLLDIPRFTNSQEFHKTLSHISTLLTAQLNNSQARRWHREQ